MAGEHGLLLDGVAERNPRSGLQDLAYYDAIAEMRGGGIVLFDIANAGQYIPF